MKLYFSLIFLLKFSFKKREDELIILNITSLKNLLVIPLDSTLSFEL